MQPRPSGQSLTPATWRKLSTWAEVFSGSTRREKRVELMDTCLAIGVWTKLVPDGRSMKVGYDPRPGERPDAGSARADFSASSATDDVQPDSTKSPSMEWPRAPALLVRTPVRPSTDAPTANTLSKLELEL